MSAGAEPEHSAARGGAPDARVRQIDWARAAHDLDTYGYAVADGVLNADQCAKLAASYAQREQFRDHIVMARHGFGRGEYRYFAYPLPAMIGGLRTALYAHLAPIAQRWNEMLGIDSQLPAGLAAYLARCHDAGQRRPTPLLLKYETGDYNCLHQDLYGEIAFPIQAAILLSQPGRDFTGGEFVLTEQRPRMQSRVEVVSLQQGDAVLFPTHLRPVQGQRGTYRVNMRHGVSRVTSGQRYTAGIIFHDAA